jgi:ABC-type uncharacterized transport system permease subunit
LGRQIVWIGLLNFTTHLIWRRAPDKIVMQGGLT